MNGLPSDPLFAKTHSELIRTIAALAQVVLTVLIALRVFEII